VINTDTVPSGGGLAVIKPQDRHAISCIVPDQVFVVRQVATLAYVLTNTILMFQSV
jgi:hypothetical protein